MTVTATNAEKDGVIKTLPQGSRHSGRVSADDILAEQLAAGKTVRQAAAVAVVSERTAHRRLADSEFRQKVSKLRGEMVAAAAGRMADGMTAAADTLRTLLADMDPNVRLRAASKLIELGLQAVKVTELERRLSELESHTPRCTGIVIEETDPNNDEVPT